jgi:hypothetical protein
MADDMIPRRFHTALQGSHLVLSPHFAVVVSVASSRATFVTRSILNVGLV